MHLMHAFTMEGTPLGSVWHKLLVRAPRPEDTAVVRQTRSQRQNTAIEDKESIRWIEGLAAAQSMAMAQPQVRMICVADSEADIYEYLSHLPRTMPAQEAQGAAHHQGDQSRDDEADEARQAAGPGAPAAASVALLRTSSPA